MRWPRIVRQIGLVLIVFGVPIGAAGQAPARPDLGQASLEDLMKIRITPEMSGLEATAAIRLGERISGLHQRIVVMTAHAMTGDRDRCLAAGMDGYLSKPIDPRLLFSIVEDGVSESPERAVTS